MTVPGDTSTRAASSSPLVDSGRHESVPTGSHPAPFAALARATAGGTPANGRPHDDDTPASAADPGRETAAAHARSAAPAAGNATHSGRGVDFLALARGRRSVRAYDGRPVPRALLEELLEAACWAPSPHGRQPWRFVVLTRDAPKRRLADAMGAEWERQLALDGQPTATVATRLARSRQRIVDAPALVLACLYLGDLDRYPDEERGRAEEIMAIQSLGAALQTLLLAAFARGLDGGWMCAPLFCQQTARAALDLDNALVPHALLTIGYAARDPHRRPRRPLDELVVRFD